MILFHLPLGTKVKNQVKTMAAGVEEVLSLQEYKNRRVTCTWQKQAKAKQVKMNSLCIAVMVLIVILTLCEH